MLANGGDCDDESSAECRGAKRSMEFEARGKFGMWEDVGKVDGKMLKIPILLDVEICR